MVREVMKTYEQQLKPGVFAYLAWSLENVSAIQNIIKHLYKGTNNQEKNEVYKLLKHY